jgi:hypothetical protein
MKVEKLLHITYIFNSAKLIQQAWRAFKLKPKTRAKQI